MTPDVISRAVFGLILASLSCITGIILLATTGHQSDASLTALASLGSGAAGALAGLLTSASNPGSTPGGRRITDSLQQTAIDRPGNVGTPAG